MGTPLLTIATVVLIVAPTIPWEGADGAVILLRGKPYPQYVLVSQAFVDEWKAATGAEPIVTEFPTDQGLQRQLISRQPAWIVGLGEVPTTWALGRHEDFYLAFTMVVEPERMKRFGKAVPARQRRLASPLKCRLSDSSTSC